MNVGEIDEIGKQQHARAQWAVTYIQEPKVNIMKKGTRRPGCRVAEEPGLSVAWKISTRPFAFCAEQSRVLLWRCSMEASQPSMALEALSAIGHD